MNNVLKKIFLVLRYILILELVITVSVPMVTLGQEEIPPFQNDTIATTTLSATTSADTIAPPLLEIRLATSTEQVLEEPIINEVEAITEENTEENFIDESDQQIRILESPLQQLSVRKFTRRIVSDRHAFHACEAETFRIDIVHKISATTRIMLERDSDAPYEIEIGALPLGIDVTFAKNASYKYIQGANDRFIELAINNQSGSQKGDFSIPIIYTQKSAKDSSVICQINIVNQ